LAAVIYTDLTEKYRPKTLKLIVRFNVRGGIESEVVIDSEK
jgi:NADPH-dependent 7-cyano-7-deazaguanine reductase QueF